MRISDWSSDVCSSDLEIEQRRLVVLQHFELEADPARNLGAASGGEAQQLRRVDDRHDAGDHRHGQSGALAALDEIEICIGVVEILRHHARSEEHTSELQSLMRISYAVFCLKKKKNTS